MTRCSVSCFPWALLANSDWSMIKNYALQGLLFCGVRVVGQRYCCVQRVQCPPDWPSNAACWFYKDFTGVSVIPHPAGLPNNASGNANKENLQLWSQNPQGQNPISTSIGGEWIMGTNAVWRETDGPRRTIIIITEVCHTKFHKRAIFRF